jgi:tetratricopeptide (TPR) repeat protein
LPLPIFRYGVLLRKASKESLQGARKATRHSIGCYVSRFGDRLAMLAMTTLKVFHHSTKSLIYSFFVLLIVLGCGGTAAKKDKISPADQPMDKKALLKRQRAFDHFTRAFIYEYTGNFEKAADEYRLALFYDPESDELRRLAADLSFKLQRYYETIDLVTAINEPTLDDVFLAAECYHITDNDKMAAEYFKLASEIDPYSEMANNFLANYHAGQGDFDRAEYYYKRLIEYGRNRDAWQIELASFYIKNNKEDKALKIYQSLIDKDSLDNRGYLGIAVIRENQNDTPAADSLYRFLARTNWDDVSLLSIISQSFIRLNNFEMAIEVTRRIAELYPDDYFTQRRLALLYFNQQNYPAADSMLVELSYKIEDDPLIYYYRGRIAQIDSNYALAESFYKESIAIDDTLTEVWINLGLAQSQAGEFDRAMATFDTALARCPHDSIEIYYYLGVFHARDERYDRAIDSYLKVLAAQPENVVVMFNLGAAYERSGQFENAEKMFLKLIEHEPDNSIALNYLGYMYADKGIKLDKAEKMIKRALEFLPDNSAYLDSYAWVLYKKGKFKEALEYQLKALNSDSDDPLLYEHLGDIYHALKNFAEAMSYWNRALELDPDNQSLKEKLSGKID